MSKPSQKKAAYMAIHITAQGGGKYCFNFTSYNKKPVSGGESGQKQLPSLETAAKVLREQILNAFDPDGNPRSAYFGEAAKKTGGQFWRNPK